jgi:two-component system, OmpR family, phosphate regulon sensor histidine kinase PhoR
VTDENLNKLARLIGRERDALLSSWRLQARQLPSARDLTIPVLNDHIPALLNELGVALQAGSSQTIPEVLVEGSPSAHGLQRLQEAFDIQEVVAEYNILRGCVHDLAENNGLSLQGEPFHVINRVFDQAIGLALQTYATQQALEVQKRREEYLAFVAHDLRTPLNAISLATRLLELTFHDQTARAETAQMLETLGRNVKQLQALVEKIIEENSALRTETGVKLERRNFDLWPLVEVLIHDLRPVAATSNTQLINQVPHNLVVFADATVLRRVFQNLIANAIKFTPGGKVIVEARELSTEKEIECSISDTGVGMPEAQLERVFDELEPGSAVEGGLGLGLAIVKTFVEAHGGRVSVESKEEFGSKFQFTLPTEARIKK